jgi:hypothetical protein
MSTARSRIWDHLPCLSLEVEHHDVEFFLLGGRAGSRGAHYLARAIPLNSLMREGSARRHVGIIAPLILTLALIVQRFLRATAWLFADLLLPARGGRVSPRMHVDMRGGGRGKR